jgi:hypothetical protein
VQKIPYIPYQIYQPASAGNLPIPAKLPVNRWDTTLEKMEVTWNRTHFSQLGKVRVRVWETIFAIIVPVDLSCYIFGGWCVAPRVHTIAPRTTGVKGTAPCVEEVIT